MLWLITVSFLGTENPLPERPREKEEPVLRDTNEVLECHLGDMLQQLHSVNASKPSERGLVRQGGHCRAKGGENRAGRGSPSTASVTSSGTCVCMSWPCRAHHGVAPAVTTWEACLPAPGGALTCGHEWAVSSPL